MEYYPIWGSQISFLYLVKVLAEKYNANIIIYNPIPTKLLKKYYLILSLKLKINFFKIYSLYSNKIIIPKLEIALDIKEKSIINRLKKIKKKKELLDFKIYGVLVGDLLYDSFLKTFNEYTIDINSKNFQEFAKKFIILFIYWHKKINEKKVKSIISSHPVYENAIPLRIAYSLGKDAFTSSLHSTYRHTKKNFSFNYNIKNRYSALSQKEKIKGIEISKKILKKKFLGFTTADAILGIRKPIVLKINFQKKDLLNKKKQTILIAIHSFSDAPHVFGNFIFEDHYEWLKFLGKETKKNLNFNWILKVHPIFYDNEIETVKILKRYPHIVLKKMQPVVKF